MPSFRSGVLIGRVPADHCSREFPLGQSLARAESQVLRCPADDSFGDLDRFRAVPFSNGCVEAWLPRGGGVLGKAVGTPVLTGDHIPFGFEKVDQTCQVLYVRNVDAAQNHLRLDGLLGGLLGVEARSLELGPRDSEPRPSKIAAGAVQPLARVVGPEPLTRLHTPPSLPATPA